MTSTIDPTIPADGLPYTAAPIRDNFQSAAADINALQSMNAGASPPSAPGDGTLWLQKPTGGTVYTLNIYNARKSMWAPIARLDAVNNIWIPPVGGGLPQSALAAATVDLGAIPSSVITITGAGPISSFGTTAPAGTLWFLSFNGATEIIYNATSLILPGAATLTTASGDMAIAAALGSGNWQLLYLSTSALVPAQGGTGRTSLTAHSVLIGEGASPVNFATPSVSGQVLLDQGAANDPVFGALDLGGPGVQDVLGVANGGTGQDSLTEYAVMIGNGTAGVYLEEPMTSGFPLCSNGASAFPSFQQLGLAAFPQIAQNTVLGNVTSGAAVPTALNKTQLTALINAFTSTNSGVVSASGGGTTNFLRADGSWVPTIGSFNFSLITTSGSITIPAEAIVLRLIGGGAGGGGGTQNGSTPCGGSGGGTGALIIYPLSGLTVGATLSITIGAAGTGGAAGSNGGAGSATVVSSGTQSITSASAGGGVNGVASEPGPNTGGVGGTPTGGVVGVSANLVGSSGGNGYNAGTAGLPGAGGTLSTGYGNYGWGGMGGDAGTASAAVGVNGTEGACIMEWIT